jgi:hypothetical protein
MLPWPGAFATATDFTVTAPARVPFFWTNTRSSIAAGVTAPDGSENAQKLVENSGSGTHFVQSTNGPTTNIFPVSRKIAFIAQAAGRTRIVVTDQNFEIANDTTSIGFDLSGGNVGYDNVVGPNATLVDTGMTALGDGWWLGWFDVTNSDLTDGVRQWMQQINLDNGSGTAARSISYTGDGTSGVNIWWVNMLPTTAWTTQKLGLFDDFNDLSTIDVNDTRAPGFNWYVHNLFPHSFMTTFGWTTNPPSVPTAPTTLSISSPSVLRIYNGSPTANGWGSQLWSVATDGGNGYVGTVFSPPMLMESYFFAANSGAMWGSTVNALLPTIPPSGRFLEWDVYESTGTQAYQTGTRTLHEWSNPSSPADNKNGFSSGFYIQSQWNRVAGMWIPAGSGWGVFLSFCNGQYVINTDASYNAAALPLNWTDPVIGTPSEADIEKMPVFFSCTDGDIFYIDWVKIYTNQTLVNRHRTASDHQRGVRQMQQA